MQKVEATDVAFSLARGRYQRAIARGEAALSGSDLRGKARDWSVNYHRSRVAFLSRVREAGIDPEFSGGTSGKGPRVISGYRWREVA